MAKIVPTAKTASYVVYTDNLCTVTDLETGKVLLTAKPASPNFFTAIGSKVVLSDTSAVLVKPSFKGALIATGGSGGGDDSGGAVEVAPGYMRLSYVHCETNAYIDTEERLQTALGCRITAEFSKDPEDSYGYLAGAVQGFTPYAGMVPLLTYSKKIGYSTARSNGTSCNYYPTVDGGTGTVNGVVYYMDGVFTVQMNYGGDSTWKYNDKVTDISRQIVLNNYNYNFYLGARNFANQPTNQYHYGWPGNIFSAQLTSGTEVIHDYVPAIGADGVVVFFDKITGAAKRSISGEDFGAGITTRAELDSLLERLPFTGGSLSLSVPAFMAEDAEVKEKLTEAGLTKGWTLEIVEERSFAPAASPYALRRTRSLIWCKGEPDNHGKFIDVDNCRWKIVRCYAIYGPLGNDPTAYGFEPFDSVEQAAEEWGLTQIGEEAVDDE